jgi:calreticulin
MNLASISAAILATCSLVSSKVFFSESFDEGDWQSVWKVPSQNSNQLGAWEVSPGKFYADERVSRGLRTLNDMHFYALTAPLKEQFTNKVGDLVIQFSAKNEQSLNCGGAYIKVKNC